MDEDIILELRMSIKDINFIVLEVLPDLADVSDGEGYDELFH